MVHLYVLNPVRKLRLLSGLLYKGSKRILGSVSQLKQIPFTQRPNQQCTPFRHLPLDAPCSQEDVLVRDPDYYGDSHKGFCAFQVENTLFNVHQVMLSREPSAFSDMFCLPRAPNDVEGTEGKPVLLTDTIPQFRDFLWALYAPPNELFLETAVDRLLNVATVANKYCLSSLEAWTIERIYSLAQDPSSLFPLHCAPLDICARMLDVAILCDHQKLQSLVTQFLISRTLWYDASPETVLAMAEKHGLRTLVGVCYYRQLISLERSSSRRSSRVTQTVFPESMDIKRRMSFIAAHNSLLELWESLRAVPPTLLCQGCPSHMECEVTWENMWYSACKMDEMLRPSSADVLGRMKALMLGLRKAMADAPSMTIQCKMAALEAITEARDEVIEGLVTHFMKPI
ncbi:hypothetical protein DXG01_005739 [Tephrocybe rancida]|nr:hypothetical protein DXG01_005739 [Tephrocybe rancida]